jgi:hypothetical protein
VEGSFTDFFGDQFHSTAGIALVTLVLDGLLPLLLRRLVWCGNGWGLAVDLREVGPCLGRDEAGVVRAFSRDMPALTAYLAWVVENDGLTVEVWDLRVLVGVISLNMTLILILCAIVVVAFLAAVFGIVISHVALGAVLAASVILLAICVSLPVATITIFITVVLVLVLVAMAFLGGMAVPLTVFAVLLQAAVVTTILLATAASATASFTASHF